MRLGEGSLPFWGLNTSAGQRPHDRRLRGQPRGDLPHSSQIALARLNPTETLVPVHPKVRPPELVPLVTSEALISGLGQECGHQEKGLCSCVTWAGVFLGSVQAARLITL